jgi:hypothetical protein
MKTLNQSQDIVEIATKLSGKVEINSISKSQVLPCEKGESVNDLLFIDKKFGLWFYTSRSEFNNICYLKQSKSFPTYVVCELSNSVYELK